jgi:iron complex outermembrane receptor protein
LITLIKYINIPWLLLISKICFSQSNISGHITDSINAPISFVQVSLLQSLDSSLYLGVISDENGNYSFGNLKRGNYFIKVMALGYSDKFSAPVEIDDENKFKVIDIKMNSLRIDLSEVSITSLRNFFEFKNGNVTVTIEGSPLAVGNTLYDLLSRMPGVTIIDADISIQGTHGAKILLDGRLQQFSGSQLINLLKSINASSIEKIEIMKNPSVKYDASGASGIINVKTKKLKIVGVSGNLNSTYTQAFYSNGLSSLELNYKGKKINLFSSLSLTDESYRKVNYYNRLVEFNSLNTQLQQTYIEKEHSRFYASSIGADWFFNSKNTMGVKVSSWGGVGYYDRSGRIDIKNSDLGYDYSDFGFHKENPFNYSSANINFEHKFDTLGTKITTAIDYGYNSDLYTGKYFQNYYDHLNYGVLPGRIYRTDNRLNLRIIACKLDFEKQLTKTVKLETGFKNAYQTLLSDFYFANMSTLTGEYLEDSSLTNIFAYNEQISAAYANFQKTAGKFNFQLGFRVENTKVSSSGKFHGIGYRRQYLNLFPLFSIDYNYSKKHSWQLFYNRRIERPDYNSFNPYRIFRNLLVSDMGNPFLIPMYINSVALSHTFKGSITNSISYTKIENIFFANTVQNDSTKEVVTSTQNLRSKDVFAYNLFLQRNVTKWWVATVYTSSSYFSLNGYVNGLNYNTSSYSFYCGTNNQFLLKKNKIEVGAFYTAPWIEGIILTKARWNFDMAIRRSLIKEKLNLVIGCSDVFFTAFQRMESHFGNLNWSAKHTNDTRRVRISLSYNFGKLKVQQREIKSNEEERKRLKH